MKHNFLFKWIHFKFLVPTLAQINLFLMIYGFGVLADWDLVFEAYGFPPSYFGKPTLIGLLIVFQFIFAPYHQV